MTFDYREPWVRQFQEDMARSVDRAIALAQPPCACGHSVNAHSDRAITACISDNDPPTRCWCDGYTARTAVRTTLL